MFFHVQIFFYSLIFLGIAELSTTDFVGESLSFLSARGSFFIETLLVLVLVAYFFQVARKISAKASMAPIPIVLSLSTLGLLFFAQSIKQQQALIILSSIAYYFLHLALHRLKMYDKDQTAHGLIAAGGIATIFLFYSVTFGIYLNFNIPLWIFMFVMMLATSLISFQYFWIINRDEKNVLNYSLVLGLIMAEIVWILNFWPFGYLTTGAITLIFYYVFWDLVQSHFLNELSKKRVISNMIIFGILVALILSSTPWLPVV